MTGIEKARQEMRKRHASRTGLISFKTENGWEPWGIGTFADALDLAEESGNGFMSFQSLGRSR